MTFDRDTSIIHLLNSAARGAESAFERKARSSQITFRQLLVLHAVAAEGSPNLGRIAAACRIDRSNATHVVKLLDERQLVTRRRARTNATNWEVRITSAGRAMLDEALPLLTALESDAIAGWTAAERQMLPRLLKQILLGLAASED